MFLCPTVSSHTYTLFPHPTLFRSHTSMALSTIPLAIIATISVSIVICKPLSHAVPIGCATAIAPGTHVGRIAASAIPIASPIARSEEHTSELQSLMRISYAVFCLKKKNQTEKAKHSIETDHK